MIKANNLEKTISDNLNRIAKVFADEFTLDSIDLVREGFANYLNVIVEHPCDSKSSEIPFSKFNCVYFLMDGDYVAYVGQTSHLSARVSTHVADGKEFDSVSWVCVESSEMLLVEAFNIAHHNPSLNVEMAGMKELVLMVAKRVS